MLHCVNIKHPDIVSLSKELNLHPAITASKVAVWQDKNNEYNRFPNIDELVVSAKEDISSKIEINKITKEQSKSKEKLFTLLKEFCSKNNIKVEVVDGLKTQYGDNINGLYSALERLIKVSETGDITTLPEEVGHAVEDGLGRNNILINRLYQLLDQFDYLSELDPKYKDLYNNDDGKLKKEYIGQSIGKAILNEYNAQNEVKSTFLNVMKRALNSFINLFKKAKISDLNSVKQEIEQITGQLAKDILKGSIMGLNSFGDSILYQINSMSHIKDNAKQLEVFTNRIKRLQKRINSEQLSEDQKVKLSDEIAKTKGELLQFKQTGNLDIVIELGNKYLDMADEYLGKIESGKYDLSQEKSHEYVATSHTIEAFTKFPALSNRALQLQKRLDDIMNNLTLDIINSNFKGENKLTIEDLLKRGIDINKFKREFGALVDNPDLIASSIGLEIKKVQNKVSVDKKKLADKISKAKDNLLTYTRSKGIKDEDAYNIFIQSYKGSTILTKPYKSEYYEKVDKLTKEKDWKELRSFANFNKELKIWEPKVISKWINPNYSKIQQIKEYKEFYDFYTDIINDAFNRIPITRFDRTIDNSSFIANIKRESIRDILKSDKKIIRKLKDIISSITKVSVKEHLDSDTVLDDSTGDKIPIKYISSLSENVKTKDLSEALYTFTEFAIAHEAMSDILPKLRILQSSIARKEYIKSSNPTKPIAGIDTNLHNMVKRTIDMQIRGLMKEKELKFNVGDIKDENGKIIGKKYVHGSEIVDFGLKYNSLLRIGLNPLNALVNVAIGDIGNIVEAHGGRYFNKKGLAQATNIFMVENLSKKSQTNRLLELFNPLQELEDYQYTKNLVEGDKKLTSDRIKDLMYSPQRIGEKFLQTRTMIAMMLKQEIIDNKGNATNVWDAFKDSLDDNGELKKDFLNKYFNGSKEEFYKFQTKLTDKIQRVNQMIHGRYSERDAAVAGQHMLWRMVFQFKKWIPAAIEARFGKKQQDIRLGDEIEGRYITAIHLLRKVISDKSLKPLLKGNMSELEIYNMRKNFMEALILTFILSLFYMLKWDDEEERKKNPYFKVALDLADRASGDLLFWYNPKEMVNLTKSPIAMAKTASDIIKMLYNVQYALSYEDGRQNYKSGPNKGYNKFMISLFNVTPVANQAVKVNQWFNKQKWREYETP